VAAAQADREVDEDAAQKREQQARVERERLVLEGAGQPGSRTAK
jgi:hypothetical protein